MSRCLLKDHTNDRNSAIVATAKKSKPSSVKIGKVFERLTFIKDSYGGQAGLYTVDDVESSGSNNGLPIPQIPIGGQALAYIDDVL